MIRPWLDKNARSVSLALLMAMLFLYFVYITVQGDRGVLAMLRMQHNIRTAETTLAALRDERAALGLRVKHLRPDSLDLDLLDEQARLQLNRARAVDLVVLTPPEAAPAALPLAAPHYVAPQQK
jgi:cell division protein FtsB